MDSDYYKGFGYNPQSNRDPNQDSEQPMTYDGSYNNYQDTMISKEPTIWPQQDQRRQEQNSDMYDEAAYYQNDSNLSNPVIGLLFPVSEQEPATWSMPGAFKTEDGMDLDHSPPFTVALDMYFDAITLTMNEERQQNVGVFNQETQLGGYKKTYQQQPFDSGVLITETQNIQLRGSEPNAYNFQMTPTAPPTDPLGNVQMEDNPDLYPQEIAGPSYTTANYLSEAFTPENNESIFKTASIPTPEEDGSNVCSSGEKHDVRHRPSILVHGADLLPLTTTNSLTPSVSSLHLTQPSYFSANQFLRSLFDQPPSLIHRPSIDLYSRQRLSIDSQNSGAKPVQNSSRSFASYFPFMGDRERKLPVHQNPPEWVQSPSGQHRHLIRSIFKSSNEVPENPAIPEDSIYTETPVEEEDLAALGEGGSQKKAKRPRRGLFTRLRQGKTEAERPESNFSETMKSDLQESEFLLKQEFGGPESDKPRQSNDSFKLESTDPTSMKLTFLEVDAIKAETQSSAPSNDRDSSANSLNKVNSTGYADGNQEPNYGALFQGVGKRRNLVGIKSKKSKATEPTVKMEIKQEPDSERLSLSNGRSSNDNDARLTQSHPYSQCSSMSNESNLEGQGSSFASASKRMLGSRLLKRRGNTVRNETQSDVVEIDLQSLDLPPNTEILPQINPNNRTRGRKEDKAADMEDQSKIYVCGYCSRRFKRQEHLKRHFRSLHTSEKPYECPICQKKFSRTDNLNQHLKVHKQEDGDMEEE